MKIRILIALVMWLSTTASVHAETRNEKIVTLMDAQGLTELFSQQIETGNEQKAVLGQQMIDKLMSQIDPTPEFEQRFSEAFTDFMHKVSAPWGPDEIVAVWAKYYGSGFTDQELDRLIEFYTSPLGKKEVQVSQKALTEFTNHFQEAVQPIMESATEEYIIDLKAIAVECDCAK